MKRLIPLFILIFLFCSSFSRIWIHFEGETTYINIDNPEDSIPRLKFEIDPTIPRRISKKGVEEPYITTINILTGDSLFYQFKNKAKAELKEWQFPEIPEGFELSHPTNTTEVPILTKNNDFTVQIINNYNACYIWEYESIFSEPSSRWMFNEDGKPEYVFVIEYERWGLQKDRFNIQINKKIPLKNLTTEVFDSNGERLDTFTKYKRNETNRFALLVPYRLQAGEEYYIRILLNENQYYIRKVIIPPTDGIVRLG